jgi:hypothetical protein
MVIFHSFLYVHQRVVHQEILEFYQEQLGINPAIFRQPTNDGEQGGAEKSLAF